MLGHDRGMFSLLTLCVLSMQPSRFCPLLNVIAGGLYKEVHNSVRTQLLCTCAVGTAGSVPIGRGALIGACIWRFVALYTAVCPWDLCNWCSQCPPPSEGHIMWAPLWGTSLWCMHGDAAHCVAVPFLLSPFSHCTFDVIYE